MTSEEKEKGFYGSDEESTDTMQKFLTDAGLYERGMSDKQMRELVEFLKEPNEMHENRNSQCFQPPDSPAKNIVDNNNEKLRTYANKVKNSSKDERTEEKREMSTESKNIFGSNENARVKKHLSEHEKRALRRKKHDMDVLNAIIPDNEEPLDKPNVEDYESTDYWSKKEISIKQRVEEFSKLLEQLRDAWIMEKSDVAAESELEWGSPIEVDHRMFSSDRKMMANKFETESMRESVREPLSRASKRKANTLIENINNHSDSEHEANDDNDDDDVDSALLKKRKPQQERRKTNANGSKMHIDVDIERVPDTQTPSTSYSLFQMENEEEKDNANSDNDDIFDLKIKEKDEEIYPRKIQPPTPSVNKARRGKPLSKTYRGPRAKKSYESSANKQITNEDAEFHTINDSPPEVIFDCERAELQDISPQTNMKALKMPLAEKRRLSMLKLKELENIEKAKNEEGLINLQNIEDEKRKKQEELVKRRLAEKEELEKLAKARDERGRSLQIKWNNVLNDKTKSKDRIKDNKNLSAEEIQEELFCDDVVICEDNLCTEQSSSSSREENDVMCPICKRFFHKSDIATHASGCNQFEIDDTSSPIIGKRQRRESAINEYKCSICNNYSTTDGNTYMEHVELCSEENRRLRDSNLSERDFQANRTSERKHFNLRGRH